MDNDVVILLPAYNEAPRIAEVIGELRDATQCPILVVDDGSADGTAEKARAAGATAISLPFNMGYGAALQTGYKYAQAMGFAYLVQMDADGQHDPRGVARLLERVRSGACDVCIGSRFLEGDTYRIPLARRMGMMLFRRIASFLIGATITDPTSGFQALNRKVIDFFCRDLYPVDYPDTDVIVALHRHGFVVREVPVVMRANPDGKSIHAGLRPIYYLFKMALTIPLNLLRREA